MKFDYETNDEQVGIKVGFTIAYFLFTTILFAALSFTGKLGGMNYFHVMLTTSAIVYIGLYLRKALR